MNEYVADTHALFWYLLNMPQLGSNADAVFDDADNGNAVICIPAIVFAELYYMNVKLKYQLNYAPAYQKIKQSGQFRIIPFEADDVLDFDRNSAVKEMHDRMIVGVARRLNAPLLTKDQNITASNLVAVIW